MTENEDWVHTEERLELVAGSMVQLLAQIRPWISDRLVGGSREADGCRDRKRSGGADKLTTALAGLLKETDREDSLRRHVVGRKMLLEYDKDMRFWNALIDGIGERGCGLCGKLEALSERSTGSAVLMSWSGAIMLVQGIHHIKFGMTGELVEKAKAYLLFLMMCCQPKRGVAKG